MDNKKNTNATTTSRYGKKLNLKSRKAPLKSSQLMKLFEDELMYLYWSKNTTNKTIHKMQNIENV